MDAGIHDVAVVGAGPYGLATGAHLRSRGLDVVVFGSTMSSWREAMPAGMFLRSELSASSISCPEAGTTLADNLARTNGSNGSGAGRVPVNRFIDYGTCFADSQLAD